MFLSIITPTYNRGKLLIDAYESLCNQTDKDFEWIIIDDGSIDNTKDIVNSFDTRLFHITYIKQENGGKHRAHNVGVKAASGKLIMCLDSDDMLTDECVERAKKVWKNHRLKNVNGILALRGDRLSQEAICSRIPKQIQAETMFELQNKYQFKGDTVLFFKRDLLKNNLFPEFEGEKFLTEGALYNVLDHKGKMILVDEVWYLTEYLEGGLTSKYHTLLRQNPRGTVYAYYQALLNAKTFQVKMKYIMLMDIYEAFCKEHDSYNQYRVLRKILYIPSKFYYLFRLSKLEEK